MSGFKLQGKDLLRTLNNERNYDSENHFRFGRSKLTLTQLAHSVVSTFF